jgi:histidine ammonia-lyase
MGANAATKAFKIVENIETILAIELFNASQALSFRKHKTSPFLENFISLFRESVKVIENDIEMAPQIAKAKAFINNFNIDFDVLNL